MASRRNSPSDNRCCLQIDTLKSFLKEQFEQISDLRNPKEESVEIRQQCLTRGHQDSAHTLSAEDELRGQLIMTIWQQLHTKHCPSHYRIGFLHLIDKHLSKELKLTKTRDEIRCTQRKSVGQQSGTSVISPILYDSQKLQQFTISGLNDILLKLAGMEDDVHLSQYADCSLGLCQPDNDDEVTFTVAQTKNKSRKMEDCHVCLPRFGEMWQLPWKCSLYGVFDGHSGSLAATYAANHLPYLLSQQLKHGFGADLGGDDDFYREAFENAFLEVDRNFTQNSRVSGCTAVCALLKYEREIDENEVEKVDDSNCTWRPYHLYVAWVGDSRALLASPDVPLQLVQPHKPDNLDEKQRIESMQSGGAIMFIQGQWRVNGIINLSRSIGDFSVPALIAEPDFIDVPVQPAHDFLLLGTDGFWDYVSESQILKTVYESLLDEALSLAEIPRRLIELAKEGDSQDNITVTLVLLKKRLQIVENYKQRHLNS